MKSLLDRFEEKYIPEPNTGCWIWTASTLGMLFLSACVRVDPGEEAVLVAKPWVFGHGGIYESPVKTGLAWIAPTTQAFKVSVLPWQYSLHFEDLMSLDGVPLDFDAIIRLQVTDSVKLIKEFGEGWYANNVKAEFSNRVRQAVRKHGMNETAISTKAIEEIDNEISEAMSKYLKESGLPVKLIQVTVGKANPPDSIKGQRVETAAQQQRTLTEGQKKVAEDARKLAEESRAKADNAYREAMQLSPAQFIELEKIHMQDRVCGKGGCTFIIGQSGISPVIGVGK